MRAYQNAATILLRQLGRTILQNMDRVDRIKTSKLADGRYENSLVANLDQTMIDRLQELYPSHQILSQYSGKHQALSKDSEDNFTWVIDAFDGIENFMSGLPCYAISMAMFQGGQCQLGIVYNPLTDEVFTATRDQGAFFEGKKIRAHRQQREQKPLIAIMGELDFSSMTDEVSAIVKHEINSQQIRNLGCVSLTLANHAASAFDLVYGRNIAICSAAAGLLIASEAQAIIKQEKASERMLNKVISATSNQYR